MKKCKNCGVALANDSQFCHNCGMANIPKKEQQVQANSTTNKPTKKKGKIRYIVFTIIAIVTGVVLFQIFFGSASRVEGQMNEKHYNEAISIYNSSVKDDFLQSNLLKGKLNKYEDEAINTYKSKKLEEDFNDAIQVLEALQNMGFGDKSSIINDLNALHDEKLILDLGNQYYNNKDYENAIIEFSKISQSSDEYQNVSTKLNESVNKVKQNILATAGSYFEKNDYENAISTIKNSPALLNEDEDVKKALSTYVTNFEKDCNANAQKYFEEKDYERAISTLEHGISVIGESTLLSDKLKDIKDKKPIKLVDTTVLYDGNNYHLCKSDDNDSFDIGSHTYYEGFKIDGYRILSGAGYVLLDLNGEYSEISFDYGYLKGNLNNESNIVITLDGKIDKTYKLTDQNVLQSATINLAHSKSMKISLPDKGDIGFVNVYLKK